MLQATTLLGDNTIPILQDLLRMVRDAGVEVEFELDRPADERLAAIRAGEMDVVFACGLLTAELIRDDAPIDVVAAAMFPGEVSAVYRSEIVVRDDSPFQSTEDALAGRLAVNEYGSWSGWRAWERHLAARGRSAEEHPTHVVSGGHVHSIELVRSGIADVAAIDSSIWAAADAEVRTGLRVIDRTQDWPAPPLSLARSMDERPAQAIREVLTASPGWHPTDLSAYQVMLD